MAWSLLDDGIEISDQASFSVLKTCDGEPLLAGFAGEYPDERMLIARKAAYEVGHLFDDVVLCCKASDIDSTALTNELLELFAVDEAAAVARARSLGEICNVAEDIYKAAIYLGFDLATDEKLPKALRVALNGPIEIS